MPKDPIDSFEKFIQKFATTCIVTDAKVISEEPLRLAFGGKVCCPITLVANFLLETTFESNQVMEAADAIGMPRLLAHIISLGGDKADGHERDVRDELLMGAGTSEKRRPVHMVRCARGTNNQLAYAS
jgi:hypothetical protein